MKKTLLILFLILIAGYSYSQDVDRQCVLLEKFTGTWCSPCAGAEYEMERVLEEGYDYGVIEYHQGADVFKNELANKRASYYTDIRYPSFFIDGEYLPTPTQYFQPLVDEYNARMAKKSPLFIEVEKTKGATTQDWSFNVKVNKMNAEFNDVQNIRFFATIVESDIRYSWYGFDRINHLGRISITSLDGEPVVFEQGVYSKQLSISLDKEILVGNCDATFFVQDIVTGEVLQAYKIKLIDGEVVVGAPSITKTEQLIGTQSIIVEWKAPKNGNANLLGYNVYNKSNTKLNKDIVTDDYFVLRRQNISSEQCVYVTAVYDLVESANSTTECATVVLLKSVTKFDTINRGNADNLVKLIWDLPAGYEKGSGNEQYVIGYNVYRNAQKVNADLIKETAFNDIVGMIGKYEYSVTAVYRNPLASEDIESPKTDNIVVNISKTSHTSVSDIDKLDLVIYPNPADNFITVHGEYDILEIYNTSGKLVITTTGETQVYLGNLDKGLYLVKARYKDNFGIYKIVKK